MAAGIGAGCALLVAVFLVLDEAPGGRYYLEGCPRVVDWIGRQETVCNQPLLDRAAVAGALAAVAGLLVVEAFRTAPAVPSRNVRAINLAIATVAAAVALRWADVVTDGTALPSAGALAVSAVLLLGAVSLLPVGGSSSRRARWLVPLLLVVPAAVVAAYAVRLWSGNGA